MRLHSIEHKICIFLKILENPGKILEKLFSASYQAMPSKTIPMSLFTISILHAIFCSIPCYRIGDITITRILEKRNSIAPYWDILTKIASLLFMMIYVLHINFYEISSTRNWDALIPKFPEKMLLHRQLLRDFQQKLIEIYLR